MLPESLPSQAQEVEASYDFYNRYLQEVLEEVPLYKGLQCCEEIIAQLLETAKVLFPSVTDAVKIKRYFFQQLQDEFNRLHDGSL